ncbi:MAG: helix-turn-helix domain-containing protein [Thermodesulfobacteriota bacterium]
MESPGSYIRREREHRGISLTAVHEATRVPLNNLKALEEDRFGDLPHRAFIKGYLKAVCKYLGLDETDTLLRYEMFLRETSLRVVPAGEDELPGKPSPVSINSKNIVSALVVFGVVIIIAFYFVFSMKTTVETVPGDSAAPAPEAPSLERLEKVEEAPSGDADLIPAGAEKTNEVKGETGGGEHVLSITASEDVWIQTALDGGEPFEVLLKEGESVEWKAKDNFSLVIGNAAGVSLTMDGWEFPRLGERGKVVRLSLPPAGAVDKDAGPVE